MPQQKISVFFDPQLRASRPSQATNWQKTRYISRIATAGDHARGPLPAIPQVTAVDDQFGTHRDHDASHQPAGPRDPRRNSAGACKSPFCTHRDMAREPGSQLSATSLG